MTIKEMSERFEKMCDEKPEVAKENIGSILFGLLGMAALATKAANEGAELSEDMDIESLLNI